MYILYYTAQGSERMLVVTELLRVRVELLRELLSILIRNVIRGYR